MNEEMQNLTLDKIIQSCPVLNNYKSKLHNVEIKKGNAYTLCEIDDLYEYDNFVLIGENKCRDSHACHKKMEKQIKRMKRYENFILKKLDISKKPVYYFYAHFECDMIHINYMGLR